MRVLDHRLVSPSCFVAPGAILSTDAGCRTAPKTMKWRRKPPEGFYVFKPWSWYRMPCSLWVLGKKNRDHDEGLQQDVQWIGHKIRMANVWGQTTSLFAGVLMVNVKNCDMMCQFQSAPKRVALASPEPQRPELRQHMALASPEPQRPRFGLASPEPQRPRFALASPEPQRPQRVADGQVLGVPVPRRSGFISPEPKRHVLWPQPLELKKADEDYAWTRQPGAYPQSRYKTLKAEAEARVKAERARH